MSSSTLSFSVSSNELGNAQHGATQLGAKQAMPIDYRFRGDISDKNRCMSGRGMFSLQ